MAKKKMSAAAKRYGPQTAKKVIGDWHRANYGKVNKKARTPSHDEFIKAADYNEKKFVDNQAKKKKGKK